MTKPINITLASKFDGNEIYFKANVKNTSQIPSYNRAFRDACSVLQILLKGADKTDKIEGKFDMKSLKQICLHKGEFEYSLFLHMTEYFIKATGHTITRFGFPLGDDGEPVSEDTLYIHFTK